MPKNDGTTAAVHREGAETIAARNQPNSGQRDEGQAHTGLSLLFAAEDRPSASDMERLVAAADGGRRIRISHLPPDAEGWIEFLSSGLTFDCLALAPAEALPAPPIEHQFGISIDIDRFHFVAVRLMPGRHIAAGAALLPVVRTLVGLAAELARLLPVKAVCWNPARCLMESGYFQRVTANWLAGGSFPALGLTAVTPDAGGGARSSGLDYLAGQEVRVEAIPGEPPAEAVKVAVRVIDQIVRSGPLRELFELQGPSGYRILAEPSHDGRLVKVWRAE